MFLRSLYMGVFLVVSAAGVAIAQDVSISSIAWASNVIVPQSRVIRVDERAAISVTGVDATVRIVEQVATTTMDISLRNGSDRRQEAELMVPVPAGAVIKGFLFEGSSDEPTAKLLHKEEATKLYNSIVAKVRDPALLEFVGLNLVRSSVFPVEPNGTQKIRLIYEHLLTAAGDRVDYVLPRSQSVDYRVPWHVSVEIKSKRPIATLYSPTHQITTDRNGPGNVTAKIAEKATTEPGPFQLSYLMDNNDVAASLMAYPNASGDGGYFLLLAGVPATPPKGQDFKPLKRELMLVLDRSGSMGGEKIEQVRNAAMQIIAGLEEGESFNILIYNETVDSFSERSVVKSRKTESDAREFLESIKASGGTNIHDALHEALRRKPNENTLPIILFLTDGLPTVGQTSETAIRDLAMKANRYEKRIFTFGVGVDVNTALLEKMAYETRGTSTFVLPGEDVEVKVAQVFKRLAGPILANAQLSVHDEAGRSAPARVQEVLPRRLPDVFDGDQLVVLGRYAGDDPLNFVLSGNYYGTQRDFKFTFALDDATTRNGFVPRLWASRKIGVLIEAVRQLGANGNSLTHQSGQLSEHDKEQRLKELTDEIVRLSREFGILTEYTAFLAEEGTDLNDFAVSQVKAERLFLKRAFTIRGGIGGVNQEVNNSSLTSQLGLNLRNEFYDAKMGRVSITTVQQINDLAFYRRGNRWIDSRVTTEDDAAKNARVVEAGTPEYVELVNDLAKDGRQGSVALNDEVLMMVDNQPTLVRNRAAK